MATGGPPRSARRVGHDLSFKGEFDQEAMRAMFPQNFPPAH